MAKKQEAEKHVRVKMVQNRTVEISPGSFVFFREGELYLLPEKDAQKWIKEGFAVDPDAEVQG